MNDAHNTPPGEHELSGVAEILVGNLIRADRRRKLQVWLLYAACVVLAGVTALSLWNGRQASDLARQNQQIVREVKNGAIASCEAGNRARNTNKLVWDSFLTLLISNPIASRTKATVTAEIAGLHLPADIQQGLLVIVDANWTSNPDAVKLVTKFEDFIASHEYPVNCQAVYSKSLGLG